MQQIAGIIVEDWKTAYRGIMDDDFLDLLTIEQEYRKDLRRYWEYEVAEEDHEIVGVAWSGTTDEEPADCEIIALYVRYSKRGNGIGRALMLHAMDCFRQAGKETMIIWCLKENGESRKFYEKMGGKVYKEGTHRWGDRMYDMISYLYPLGE